MKEVPTYTYFIKKTNGVDFIHVIRSDGFKVILADLGASIYQVDFQNKIMTLTPKYVSDFKNPKLYHGKTVGRYANRIKDGVINVAGQIYHLDQNEYPNTLHSGASGFSNRYFEYEIQDNETSFAVIFSYNSPDLDAGFPGEMDFRVCYIFHKIALANFQVLYQAKTKYETLFRPCNHAYFNIGHDDIEELGLYVKADKYVIPDEKNLLPKRMDKVPPYLDFISDIYRIKKATKNEILLNQRCFGIDHYFKFKDDGEDTPSVILTDGLISLSIHTDFEGTQIYSDNYEDGVIYKDTKKKNHRGVAIEPSDSPFKKNILKPMEYYRRTALYIFHYTPNGDMKFS